MRFAAVTAAAFALGAAAQAPVFFSGAVSQGQVTQTEKSVLFHQLSPGAPYGMLTHW